MRLHQLLILLALAACYPKEVLNDSADDSPTDDSPTDDSALNDADGDGSPAELDCDDADPTVYPGAAELCDGLDNNCDQQIDEGVQTAYYGDADQDGYGRAEAVFACEAPAGTVTDNTDCDDTDARYHPNATEDCADPNDYNCDGSVGYADNDNDGVAACQDCDDNLAVVHPGAEELCDGRDNDCDQSVDEDVLSTFYNDNDQDGFGDVNSGQLACEVPEGYVSDASDCDDTEAGVNPGATELCNSVDDDCDALIDDADDSLDLGSGSAWYADLDEDGYGDPTQSTLSCLAPSGRVANGEDCDDTEGETHPGASEVCNAVDDDCDALIDDADDSLDRSTGPIWYSDADQDGYGDPATDTQACAQPSGFVSDFTDCDDADATIHPSATESCDNADNDCDLVVDEGLTTPSLSFTSTDPLGSCGGSDNVAATVSVCGCDDVVVLGAFADLSDGSDGQVVTATTTATGFELVWDDVAAGDISDCDLDISEAVDLYAAKSGLSLTVDVEMAITGYDAGNLLGAGYTVTDYDTVLSTDEDYVVDESTNVNAQSYTFTCDF